MVRLTLVSFLLLAPAAWAQRCTTQELSDSVCDCGCGTADSACPPGRFVGCRANHCNPGQVPWEHQPWTCMSSACGDGWRDEAGGEACDDGNALASGGCSADCRSVNPGYTCGNFAQGCQLATPDAGSSDDAGVARPAQDAGTPPGGSPDAGTFSPDAGPDVRMTGGCSVGDPMAFSLLLALALARRRA